MGQDEISGANPMIMAPVQTASPKNYGGSELHIGLGFNHDLSLLTSKKDTIPSVDFGHLRYIKDTYAFCA